MNDYQYTLKPYKSPSDRETCPSCGHKKCFARYVNVITHEELPSQYGRCNRESNCSYHLNPYTDGYGKDLQTQWQPPLIKRNPVISAKPMSVISHELVKQSRSSYNQNHFVSWLINLFGTQQAIQLISTYHIGTSKHWPGSSVFWQIDNTGKVRTGKVMLYDPQNGKRVKKPFNHINWVHKLAALPDFELKQCFFGEHLLINCTKPVAIVESEKTAIIASAYLPHFTWLASGGLSNLTIHSLEILQGKNVCLFPDLNGFEKWNQKAVEISRLLPKIHFIVSDILQQIAQPDEFVQGLDLADYLIRFDWHSFSEFTQQNVINQPQRPQPPATRINFPLAPFAFDIVDHIRAVRSCVIPPGEEEVENNLEP